jgi:hypothetical protein
MCHKICEMYGVIPTKRFRTCRIRFRLIRTRFESTKLAWREVLQPVHCSAPSSPREGMFTFQRVEHVPVSQVPAVVPSFVHGPVVLLGVLHHERVLRTSHGSFGVKRNWLTLGGDVPLDLPCLLDRVLAYGQSTKTGRLQKLPVQCSDGVEACW